MPYQLTEQSVGWPRCARCGKPVERIERHRDIYREAERFIVFCHGEREEAALTAEQMIDSISIEAGEAFVTKPLLGG